MQKHFTYNTLVMLFLKKKKESMFCGNGKECWGWTCSTVML